jgi:hypothetical protein
MAAAFRRSTSRTLHAASIQVSDLCEALTAFAPSILNPVRQPHKTPGRLRVDKCKARKFHERRNQGRGLSAQANKRTKDEMSLDMLFGLHATTDALLKAIVESHPDCEKLLRQYDMRLEQGINTACKSDRSVLELAAALDYGKLVRSGAGR